MKVLTIINAYSGSFFYHLDDGVAAVLDRTKDFQFDTADGFSVAINYDRIASSIVGDQAYNSPGEHPDPPV